MGTLFPVNYMMVAILTDYCLNNQNMDLIVVLGNILVPIIFNRVRLEKLVKERPLLSKKKDLAGN